jgi:hypothetical protein
MVAVWAVFQVQVGPEVSMYTGTMIEDLVGMVIRAERNAETEILLREEIRRSRVQAKYPYIDIERNTFVFGVA